MHFHLPKPLHGWREFAGEVGIIVLGVLIALGADQLISRWEWQEKIRRAETAMRIELGEDNGPQAYGRLLIGRCLDQEITGIRDNAGKVPVDELRRSIGAYSPPFRTWDSEAWKVVVASDIGSQMGSDRLISWSAPYRIIPALNEEDQREAQLAVQLRNTLPPSGEPSADNLQSVRQTAAQLRLINRRFVNSSQLLLARIGALGARVPMRMQRELTADARAMYGSCVTVPDLNATPAAQRLSSNLKSPSLSE
jgi:hypothetical protein